MRLRNVKNKEEIMNQCSFLIKDASIYKGKWHTLFQNNNPIYIEIGMGKGKFIRENAKRFPNINYIGIEKFDSIIAKAIQKVDNPLPNLYFIRLDAKEIDTIFDHEIENIYLNFSDPWPKKRHHLRRLSSSSFLEKYDKIFSKEKRIEMRTDNQELFEYSLLSFSEKGYTLKELSLNLHKENPPLITTEYEDRFTSKDMPIYYVMCQDACQSSKGRKGK